MYFGVYTDPLNGPNTERGENLLVLDFVYMMQIIKKIIKMLKFSLYLFALTLRADILEIFDGLSHSMTWSLDVHFVVNF